MHPFPKRRLHQPRLSAFWVVLLSLVTLTGPACAAPQESGTPDDGTAEEGEAVSEESTESPVEDELEPPLSDLVAAAKRALAEKLEIDEGEIRLEKAEKVLWRDGSLGCPEPGMMYTQALIDGARIVLEAKDERYSYHSNLAGPPRHCENPDQNGALPPEEGGTALM